MANNTMPYLWAPGLVFAHLFAGFWLLQMYLIYDPGLLTRLRQHVKLCARAIKAAVTRACSKTADSVSSELASIAEADGILASQPTAKRTNSALVDVHAATAGGSVHSASCAQQAQHARQGGSMDAAEAAAMQLPVIRRLSTMMVPMQLTWHDVSCAYKSAGGLKHVLRGVYGSARPGEMQALLGPSGAGKSTLMDILAMRKTVGVIEGQVLINGLPWDKTFIRKTAYVPQVDNFVPTMTAHETLLFHARLILPAAMDGAQHQGRIQDVMEVLGLAHLGATLVGGTLPGGLLLRGLSGGERKRLSIAAGILATPSVVFLDEPTSGLDSYAALTVMGYMKQMVSQSSCMLISSIHQPRSAIWNMFDTVSVLSHGMLLYTGSREDMLWWFSGQLGFRYDPALHGVASDWLMDLVCISFSKAKHAQHGPTISSMDEVATIAAKFLQHYLTGSPLPMEVCVEEESQEQSQTPHTSYSSMQDSTQDSAWDSAQQRSNLDSVPGLNPSLYALSRGETLQHGVLQHGPLQQAEAAEVAAHGCEIQPASDSWHSAEEARPHESFHACVGRSTCPSPFLAVRRAVTMTHLTNPLHTMNPVASAMHASVSATSGTSGTGSVTPGTGAVTPGTGAVTPGANPAGHASLGHAAAACIRETSGKVKKSVTILTPAELHAAQQAAAAKHCPLSAQQQPTAQHTQHAMAVQHNMAAQHGQHATTAQHGQHAIKATLHVDCRPLPAAKAMDVNESKRASMAISLGPVPSHTAGQVQHTLTESTLHQRLLSSSQRAFARKLSSLTQSDPVRQVVRGAGGSARANWRERARARRERVRAWLRRFWLQYCTLLWREVLTITRNPADVAGRVLTFTWVAVAEGVICYGLSSELDGIPSLLNTMFLGLAFFMLMPYVSMSLFSADKQYYMGDMAANLYRPLAYYSSKVTATLPFALVTVAAYTTIFYGMVGFRPEALAVVQNFAMAALVFLISAQVLHLASIIAPNQDLAFMYSIGWTALNLLMSNYFIRYDDMYFQWLSALRYVSMLGYAFQGQVLAEFGDRPFSCSASVLSRGLEVLPPLLPSFSNSTPSTPTPSTNSTPSAHSWVQQPGVQRLLAAAGQNCTASGNLVLRYYHMSQDYGQVLGILLGYWGALHCLTFLALVLLSQRERR